MKIAVLEDNPDIPDYMKIALEMAGHNVDTYTNGSSFFCQVPDFLDTLRRQKKKFRPEETSSPAC